jgi:hypothetical protein
MPSSIADLNEGIRNQLFEIFKSVKPEDWTNPNQCFYTTAQNWGETAWRFNTLNNTQQIAFPILTLTKESPLRAIDLSLPPNHPFALNANTSVDGKQYDTLPIQFQLDCRLYENAFAKLDEYIELIMFIRNILTSGKYESSIIEGKILDYRADPVGLPKYSIIPTLGDKLDKDGRI